MTPLIGILLPVLALPSTPPQSTLFGPQQVIATSGMPFEVLAEDLSGDAVPDLLVFSEAENRIVWFEGQGGGSFASNAVVVATFNPGHKRMSAGDLDGDGDADVLSTFLTASNVSWHENVQAGTFGAATQITSSASRVTDVIASDLDGDGDLDVIWGSQYSEIAWHTNTGGSFAGAAQVIAPPRATQGAGVVLHSSDLDGDGDMDLLWADFSRNEVVWSENIGGSFGPKQLIAAVAGPIGVTTSDLDGDGDLDVLWCAETSNQVAWSAQVSTGQFGGASVLSSSAIAARHVQAADLDADGDMDVFSASEGDDTVAWYENQGGGSFSGKLPLSTTASGVREVRAADLDGDGFLDVVAALRGSDELVWYENLTPTDCNGNGIPDPAEIANGTASDCDGNGTLDGCDLAANPSLDYDGNGVLDVCECLAANFCVASGNSAGPPASIGFSGSLALSDNGFALTATNAPPFKFGLFFYASTQTQIFLGEGVLCVGPSVQRLQPVLVTDQQGSVSLPVDFTSPPFSSGPFAVTPLSAQYFQFWYRDPQGGPAGFNFSDGLEVTFCP